MTMIFFVLDVVLISLILLRWGVGTKKSDEVRDEPEDDRAGQGESSSVPKANRTKDEHESGENKAGV